MPEKITIFFVGIHNKPGMKPLDSQTKTGKIIDFIINWFNNLNIGLDIAKTNLCEVEYLPDDADQIKRAAVLWHEKNPTKSGDIIVTLGKWVQENFIGPVTPSYVKKVELPHPGMVFGRIKQEQYIYKGIIAIAEAAGIYKGIIPYNKIKHK